MNNGLLGKINSSSTTNIDQHLLIFILPLLIVFYLLFKARALTNIKASTKQKALNNIGGLSVAMFALVYIENLGMNNFLEIELFSSTLSMINNINIIMLLIFGVSVLFRRFFITRSVTPALIVFSMAKLINNPGASLTYTEIISAIASISFAIVFAIMSAKSLSLKSFGVIAIMNIALMIFVFVVASKAVNASSTFSFDGLINNPFYHGITSNAAKIILFITLTLVAQLTVWVGINVLHSNLYEGTNWSIIKTFDKEIINHKRLISKITKSFKSAFEQENTYEINTFVSSDKNEEKELETDIKPAFSIVKLILPLAVVRNKSAKGTRAPSF